MQTTLVSTGMGVISGLLAWHRCRHYRPNTAFFLTLACLGGMGAGDVRLAPVLGAHLGHAGLLTVAIGTGAAFALGAVTAAGLAVTGRLGPDRRVPFGPALLGGSVVALLA